MRGRWVLLAVLLGGGVAACAQGAQSATAPDKAVVRAYAQVQAAKAGWVGAQWQALEAIIVPESDWNPCAVFPSRSECGYAGGNSCGVPQASPCPPAWRGRLGSTWKAQVRWVLAYVARRYRDPLGALAFRRANDWY